MSRIVPTDYQRPRHQGWDLLVAQGGVQLVAAFRQRVGAFSMRGTGKVRGR